MELEAFEVHHYCSTDKSDRHLALYYFGDALLAHQSYEVAGLPGDCRNSVKPETYELPESVTSLIQNPN